MTIETPDLFDAIADAEAEAYPSAPIEGETKATVDLVANDWRSDEDWLSFVLAARSAAVPDYNDPVIRIIWRVDPNVVRERLTNKHGLTIEPRRYSAFWSRAAGKNGFLIADGWTVNDDAKGHNKGKPQRMYRLRT